MKFAWYGKNDFFVLILGIIKDFVSRIKWSACKISFGVLRQLLTFGSSHRNINIYAPVRAYEIVFLS